MNGVTIIEWHTCSRKIQYLSESRANKAAREIQKKRRDGDGIHSYKCPHCHWWHIGHNMKRR
jgi:hypothetical protein